MRTRYSFLQFLNRKITIIPIAQELHIITYPYKCFPDRWADEDNQGT